MSRDYYCEDCGMMYAYTHNKTECIRYLKSQIDKLKEFLNEKLGYDDLAKS